MASKGSRGRAYTTNEDVIISQSWISISQDPTIGVDQSGSQFWYRVFNTFKALLGTPTDRTWNSLSSRFHIISKEVSLFVAKLASVINRAASGTNEADKIREARTEYMQSTGKAFRFEECYQLLKDLPKFSLRTTHVFEYGSGTQSSEGGSSQRAPLNIDSPNSDVGQGGESSTPLSCPPGRKAAKRKAKNAAGSSDEAMLEETKRFNSFYIDTQERRISATEMKLALKKKDQEIQEQIEEDRIMGLDLTQYSDEQRYYFQCRRRQIMQKRGFIRD